MTGDSSKWHGQNNDSNSTAVLMKPKLQKPCKSEGNDRKLITELNVKKQLLP